MLLGFSRLVVQVVPIASFAVVVAGPSSASASSTPLAAVPANAPVPLTLALVAVLALALATGVGVGLAVTLGGREAALGGASGIPLDRDRAR